MTDYYTFREFAAQARGHEIVVVGKPGVWSWDALNPGTAALLEVADVEPDDRVLDLGCGTGVVGAVAGLLAPRGHVTLVDCNVAATACAERTIEANDVVNADVRLADGVIGLAPASFDRVLSHLPRGRAVQEELIRGAAWALRPGGRFYLVASKRVGVKGAIAYARELFGQCGVVRQKKGYHVALAVKPAHLRLPPLADGYVARTITLDGVETVLISKPGVFAWDRLDDGTVALVGAMEIGARDCVLDLGCGTGLAGLAAARRASGGQVTLVDADVRAVESARRTLEANLCGTGLSACPSGGLESPRHFVANAEVQLSDCWSAIRERRFDVVVANPPFHQGLGVDYEVARQFVSDAARVLGAGGRLFLVANRFLRYDDLIRETFGNVATAYADGRYHVLTAVAQEAGSG